MPAEKPVVCEEVTDTRPKQLTSQAYTGSSDIVSSVRGY